MKRLRDTAAVAGAPRPRLRKTRDVFARPDADPLERTGCVIGLGCMRLSTREPHSRDHAIAVIHAALDAGATLLDTADSYASGEADIGHNERLVAAALASWTGDRSRIRVATKGGLRRPRGAWVPDGRAKHLREACDASRRALGVDVIDLYQLHVVDPRVPLETSVRALAALKDGGAIRQIGLCNVNVSQIEAARAITDIAAVQVGISVIDEENLRNGVAEYCRDQDILLIAHRPLGGDRRTKIERDPVLRDVAERNHVSPFVVALAWLRDLHDLIAIPGATRIESARALADVLRLVLTDDDRDRLDAHFPAGRLLRVPRARRRPAVFVDGDVVLVMGMPGAGKSTLADDLVREGYERLNRDEQGGRVSDLIARLDDGLEHGRHRWVLDNTYPTRSARNEVIETAWAHGVAARCVHAATPLADAQINAINRMIRVLGSLPQPEQLRELGRTDPRFFGPDAQFRYERQVERPSLDEGFERIDECIRAGHGAEDREARALVVEFDGVLCTSLSGDGPALVPEDVVIAAERVPALRRFAAEGWSLAAIAWRPQLDRTGVDATPILACFERARALLGIDIDISWCAHPAGPPVCWCRKPLPGLLLDFAHRHRVALGRSICVGRAPADRTLAQRLGMTYHEASFLI